MNHLDLSKRTSSHLKKALVRIYVYFVSARQDVKRTRNATINELSMRFA